MARTASSHPFDALIDLAAQVFAARLNSSLSVGRAASGSTRAPGGDSANARRRKAMLGRKLDMSCRIAGCKNRSGGPGKGYMCADHQKLGKKEQQAARDAWKAKRAK